MATDENFNGRIVRGVVRRLPKLDLVRVQDIGLSGANDQDVLEAVARDGRVLLTHDVGSIPKHAYARVSADERMPGVVVCPQEISIGGAIGDIVLLAECSHLNEWENQVLYLPL